MAISMDALKAILEELDLSVETLERINALDVVEDHSAEIEAARTEALSQAQADYEARFKAAFFKGEGLAAEADVTQDVEDDHVSDPDPVDDEEILSDDDLIDLYKKG